MVIKKQHKKLRKQIFVPRDRMEITKIPCFIDEDFGKYLHEEVQKRYGKFEVITKIRRGRRFISPGERYDNPYSEGPSQYRATLLGTIFYSVAINEVLKNNELNLRIATPKDIEKILKNRRLDLRNQRIATALVLRDLTIKGDFNAPLIGPLTEQVHQTLGKPPGVMIPLASLCLEEDKSSPYGLKFKLNENPEIIDASVLMENGWFEETDEETGLPKKIRLEERESVWYWEDHLKTPRYVHTQKESNLSTLALEVGNWSCQRDVLITSRLILSRPDLSERYGWIVLDYNK